MIGLIQTGQHILQDVCMDGGIFRELGPEVFQLRFLLVARDGDLVPLPGGDALLQGRIVERAAVPQDKLKLALLFGRRPQLLLERLTQILCHVSASSVQRCIAESSAGSHCLPCWRSSCAPKWTAT